MKKVTYTNPLPYAYEPEINRNSPYRPNYQKAYKNRGETLESIAKAYRGIYTDINPATSWKNGSDIESERASVKSSEASLGRSIGGRYNSAEDKIKTFFKNTPSKVFIWMEWDRATELITEYQMNKKEFRLFVSLFTRVCNNSEHTDIAIRFRKTSNKMINWLEAQCA
jgi:hypothetical protein